MENENEVVTSQNDESIETQTEETSTETVDVAALQAKAAELEQTNRQLFERAKKAEGFVKVDNKWVKAPKSVDTPVTKQPEATGETEDTTKLLLEVKGITEDDEQELFQKWKNDTNRKPREILNNKIFQAELKELRSEKATKAAIPASNGRGGGGGAQNIDALTAKFEQTGELPKDFETKAKIIERVAAKENSSTPWRR